MDELTNLIVVIALQFIHTSNHCFVFLNLHNIICQLYFSDAGVKGIINEKNLSRTGEKGGHSLNSPTALCTTFLEGPENREMRIRDAPGSCLSSHAPRGERELKGMPAPHPSPFLWHQPRLPSGEPRHPR